MEHGDKKEEDKKEEKKEENKADETQKQLEKAKQILSTMTNFGK